MAPTPPARATAGAGSWSSAWADAAPARRRRARRDPDAIAAAVGSTRDAAHATDETPRFAPRRGTRSRSWGGGARLPRPLSRDVQRRASPTSRSRGARQAARRAHPQRRRDTLDVLTAEGARDVGGILHCFSEDVAFARRVLDLGFDLSFSGIVTFKKATSIQEAAVFAPADRILLETDSPYLAPVPLRGKPCEPAYLVHTAAFVAALRGTTVDALAAETTANAERRVGRPLGSRTA